ncbi:ABCB family ABC transporter ATP-binding protein/permease [Sphingomonas astaxanthinifaciens]|uniref:Metal ABC transporter permease n=1 Tax=Sphingomonas astaxanthinifaciens DSM 22298 TaxID=1123267 RepID=A0ABQ5Z417_9SPHN|nr:ABC transporter ATP-binding protein/permease [Sphingomonas astaxanthinifaciens]GLR46746.1 metal ABC transporter permease [Sphingomonas astaxanthinifaciens DSM 22298]
MPPEKTSLTNRERSGFKVLLRFLPYLWPAGQTGLKLRVVASFLMVVASITVTTIILPKAFGGAVDRMTAGQDGAVSVALALVVAFAVARFGGVLLDNLRNAIFETVGQEATRVLSERTFSHLHGLSLRFHLERRTGAVTKIIERGSKSIDMMLYFLLFNLAPTILQLGIVAVLFWTGFGPGLVAATAAAVVAYIWFTKAVTDWRVRLREQWTEHDTATTARAVDSLLNFETVKYFNAEERERKLYGRAVANLARSTVKIETSLAAMNIGQSLITNLLMGGAMAYTVWGWSQGRFTPGDLVVVNALLTQLFRPLDMLGTVYRTIRQGLTDMDEMFRLLDTPAEVTDVDNALPLHVERGHVRFEDVRFGYEDGREILKGLTLDVPAGQTVAVVGPSGAGKSTLARLLFRFYDPQAGRITIDGQDIAQVSQASLRAAIGIVPQDTVLFNDTLGYNIAYGRDEASQAEVEAAARGASLDRFVAALPEGYDARVGERGLKLSGGEKQRVAIARTLVKNPPILILDEATSALDSRTEEAILDTLRGVSTGRTTITIAHRLSTVVDADRIVVLDGGRVAEEGSHAELLRRNGLYADMWARQQAERAIAEAAE